MLGMIHRTVLGCGPRHFASMFQNAPPSTSQKHCWHLQSHRRSRNSQKLIRSILGSHRCLLPARVVEQKSVAAMQHELQCLLKFRAVNREDDWHYTFSPRVSQSEHPLHHFSWLCCDVQPLSRQQLGGSRCGVCVAALSAHCLGHDHWSGWSPSIRSDQQARSAGGRQHATEGNGMEAKVKGRQASWKIVYADDVVENL